MGYSKMTLVVVVVMAANWVAEGQSIPSCASELSGCVDYLSSNTTPPASCCDPLKQVVATQLPCLCNLYANPSVLASLNITTAQALHLPVACGISANLCQNATAPTSSTVPPPPGVPGNNVGRIASTGMFSLLLLWVSIMLY